VTNRVGEIRLVSEFRELDLPGSHAVAIGPAGVGGNQQFRGVRESLASHLVPSPSNGLDREL
jgi:hypothetical protein